MSTPLELIAKAIEPEIDAVSALSDDELWSKAQPWLETTFPRLGRHSADRDQRLRAFLEEEVLPVLRKLGENGQVAWNYLRDPDSAFHKDKVAAVVLALATGLGWQTLDLSTAVAIILLLVKNKKDAGG